MENDLGQLKEHIQELEEMEAEMTKQTVRSRVEEQAEEQKMREEQRVENREEKKEQEREAPQNPEDYEWTEEDQEKQRHFFSQVTAVSSLAGGLVVAALLYEMCAMQNRHHDV